MTSRKDGPSNLNLEGAEASKAMSHADFVSKGFSKVISPADKTFGAATLQVS